MLRLCNIWPDDLVNHSQFFMLYCMKGLTTSDGKTQDRLGVLVLFVLVIVNVNFSQALCEVLEVVSRCQGRRVCSHAVVVASRLLAQD